jgi:hypothetical protein
MKENEDILEKAVKTLKNEQVPPRPPQQTVDATIAKLMEASKRPNTGKAGKRIQIIERIKAARSFAKVAAAAVLLIVAGYAVGRFSTPRPPDAKQLQAVLEPAIRQSLLDEMKHYWQVGLASNYVRLKDELSEQYRHDLDQFAMQTLAASNAVTNQLLAELVQSINAAQTQDLRRIAAALEQIELNRLQDKTQLTNGLETLAYQTEDELERTRQVMVQFLANTQPDSSVPYEFRNSDNYERSKK